METKQIPPSRWALRPSDLPPQWVSAREPRLRGLEHNAAFRLLCFHARKFKYDESAGIVFLGISLLAAFLYSHFLAAEFEPRDSAGVAMGAFAVLAHWIVLPPLIGPPSLQPERICKLMLWPARDLQIVGLPSKDVCTGLWGFYARKRDLATMIGFTIEIGALGLISQMARQVEFRAFWSPLLFIFGVRLGSLWFTPSETLRESAALIGAQMRFLRSPRLVQIRSLVVLAILAIFCLRARDTILNAGLEIRYWNEDASDFRHAIDIALPCGLLAAGVVIGLVLGTITRIRAERLWSRSLRDAEALFAAWRAAEFDSLRPASWQTNKRSKP